MKKVEKLVNLLIDMKLQIATMESCTGGGLANMLTSVPGSSEVLKFSAVTYSNEYKIRLGVNKKIIDEYSVYSIETAQEMAKNIASFAQADIGIGITGKLNRSDINNDYGINNQVFISIYFNNRYYNFDMYVTKSTRDQNKKEVINMVVNEVIKILLKEV